ncbi:BQ2448_5485 [Microbotryum intermedium]|uniref:BQ2448_5485 protein n=1 Tax=Microbotryum intermedium TaxID=269621 RepID=A0A238F7N5_9BASI|nr:BQ2448_5485 [Microbotryum intermedium]
MNEAPSTLTPSSSFVPLSLTETLSKPQRTLPPHPTRPSPSCQPSSRSNGNGNNGKGRRTSHHHLPSFTCANGLGLGNDVSRDREVERKRQKELMCERLGLVVESEQREQPKEDGLNDVLASGKGPGEKDEKENELKGLRNQVLRLNEENRKLNEKVKGLQDEVAKANTRQGSNATSTTKGGASASALEGVGAIQLKELEKSFAEQESLLAGYQRDAEKSFLTIEAMKKQCVPHTGHVSIKVVPITERYCTNRARRYTDILAKTYGPNYETELGLDQENGSSLLTTTKVSCATTGISSPAIRNQRDRVRVRMSFGGAAAVTPIASRVGRLEQRIEEEEGGEEQGGTDGPSSASASAKEEAVVEQARHEMLRGYVEGVQTLLRSMEQRLLKRDHELEMMEQRAREEKQLAEAKVEHVEKLIGAIRV